MSSPYENLEESKWLAKTQELIDQHPLDLETIRRVALNSWDLLWRTTIGEGKLSVNLWELDIPSTVISYFFEKLFAKELETEYPKLWRGSRNKDDKDLVYIPDPFYSIEIKSSGIIQNKHLFKPTQITLFARKKILFPQ